MHEPVVHSHASLLLSALMSMPMAPHTGGLHGNKHKKAKS